LVPKNKDLTYIREKLSQLKNLEDRYLEESLKHLKNTEEAKLEKKEILDTKTLHEKKVEEFFGPNSNSDF